MKRIALALVMFGCLPVSLSSTQSRLGLHDYVSVSHGRYLTQVGDCEACHTVQGGAPFAGGRPVPTPFGVIYSTNITPDRDTGIGTWTDEDFLQGHAQRYRSARTAFVPGLSVSVVHAAQSRRRA
jgi:hypothetical protein